jgi:hypothetical protein
MSQLIHYNETDAQDAMSVIAKWMGKNYGLNVVFHNGTAVDADIFKGVIRIPKLACSSGLTDEALTLLRGRVYHEAGHIANTKLDKSDYPKGVLFEILNAIEDRRMERWIGDEYPGAKMVFAENSKYYNRKIANDVAEGKVNAPLWEALVAMGFQSEGLMPQWRLSEKAQMYFDAGYDTFCKWKGLRNAKGSLKLAKELFDILKDAHEEYKQQGDEGDGDENGEPQEGGNAQQGGEPQKGEPQEGEGEPQTGSPTDFDNEENEKNGAGQPGDEEEDEEGEGAGGSEETDEDGEEDATGASKGDDDAAEGAESDAEEDGAGASKDEDSDDGATATETADNDEKNKYDTNYEEQKGGTTKERTPEEDDELEKEMQDEADGKGLDEYQQEDIDEALDELDPADKKYLSRRDLDEHNIIEGDERDKEIFKRDRAEVAVAVASMVRALEQAMRARTRCRKNQFMRSGKIDKTRLTQIAKSLSKEVFYQHQKGEKLETAVEIIIDESGSMSYYREVRQVAIAVSESLAQLNIPFEVTGSTTKYGGGDSRIADRNGLSRTNPIVYDHFKLFSQQWVNVCHNMSKTRSWMHNVDGEVVEYAARRLLDRPESRKVVIVLSDGLPDAGHGNGPEMGRNITRTCERARQAGIEVYAFGLDTRDPAKFYGHDNFVYLPSGEALGPKFAAEFCAIVSGGRFKVGAKK